MAQGSDVKLGQLTRYIFTAPNWKRSLVLIVLLGLIIDGANARAWLNLPFSGNAAFTLPAILSNYLALPEKFLFSGTIAFTIPAIAAFALTKPIIESSGKTMTWNRSGLLALSCTVFGVIITLAALAFSVKLIPLFYAISLGFIFGLRLFVLVAIADYRIPRMILPALTQSGVGILAGMLLFSPYFGIFALVLHIVFGLGFAILIWMIERPLQRAFKIRGLAFVNAFIAHMTDGSKGMEDFFREIGEEIFVPQVSFSSGGTREKRLSSRSRTCIPGLWERSVVAISLRSCMTVLMMRPWSRTGAQPMISTSFPNPRATRLSMHSINPAGILYTQPGQESLTVSRSDRYRSSTRGSGNQFFLSLPGRPRRPKTSIFRSDPRSWQKDTAGSPRSRWLTRITA